MATRNDRPGTRLVQNQTDLIFPVTAQSRVQAAPRRPTHRKPPVTYQIRPPKRYEVREDTADYGGEGGDSENTGPDINELSLKLVQFADELDWVVSGHDFHYRSVQALLGEGSCELTDQAYQGLRSTQAWLRQRDEALVASMTEIRTWLRKSAAD